MEGFQPHSEYTGFDKPLDIVPLVIVEGFLSLTGPLLWGAFEDHLNATRSTKAGRRRVIFTSVGPVSSLHDRACELFYSLKGGTVQYGHQHALQNGHRPYGRTHTSGLYEPWSVENPLHFLGHSMGGPTITTMLTLIRQGFFGPDVHPSMIASVATLSAPFRGTGMVYDLGETTTKAPAVRQISVGSFITKVVHAVEYLSPLIPSVIRPDFHAESRNMTYRDQPLQVFINQMYQSEWGTSTDATPFDCTFGAAETRDRDFWDAAKEKPSETWLRSYTVTMTSRISIDNRHQAPGVTKVLSGPLYLSALSLGKFNYAAIRPRPSFRVREPAALSSPVPPDPELVYNLDVLPEEYHANDGVVPLFSQWHPGACKLSRCVHHQSPLVSLSRSSEPSQNSFLHQKKPPHALLSRAMSRIGQPGIFSVYHLKDKCTHLGIMPFWWGSEQQRVFWVDIGAWLEDVDEARQERVERSV